MRFFLFLFIGFFLENASAYPFMTKDEFYKEVVNSKMVFAGEILDSVYTVISPVTSAEKKTTYTAKIKAFAIYKGDDLNLGKIFTIKYVLENVSHRSDRQKPMTFNKNDRHIFYAEEVLSDNEILLISNSYKYGSLYNQVEECRLNAMFLWAKKEFKVTRLSGEKGFGECPPTEFEGKIYFKK